MTEQQNKIEPTMTGLSREEKRAIAKLFSRYNWVVLVGRTPEGYEQVDVRADPSFATISGAESDVNAVEKTSTDAILFATSSTIFSSLGFINTPIL